MNLGKRSSEPFRNRYRGADKGSARLEILIPNDKGLYRPSVVGLYAISPDEYSEVRSSSLFSSSVMVCSGRDLTSCGSLSIRLRITARKGSVSSSESELSDGLRRSVDSSADSSCVRSTYPKTALEFHTPEPTNVRGVASQFFRAWVAPLRKQWDENLSASGIEALANVFFRVGLKFRWVSSGNKCSPGSVVRRMWCHRMCTGQKGCGAEVFGAQMHGRRKIHPDGMFLR